MVLELSYMESQMLLSVPVEKLFYELGKKSQVEDIRNFSEIIAQAKRTGGNLRETLEKSARIIEEKIDVKKEIDSLLSAKKNGTYLYESYARRNYSLYASYLSRLS